MISTDKCDRAWRLSNAKSGILAIPLLFKVLALLNIA